MITDTFDPATKEILKPEDLTGGRKDMKGPVFSVFDEKTEKKAADILGARIKTKIYSGGIISVYTFIFNGCEMMLLRSPVGGPASVAVLENILSRGAETVLYLGSCGSLDKTITSGKIIIPDRAYRDEGTSYHYMPPSDFITLSGAEKLEKLIAARGLPYLKTGTWTTDAIFRETEGNIRDRKEKGCSVAEMECASLMAAASYRNADVYQLLYTADCLDESYDIGLLKNAGDITENLIITAVECLMSVHEEKL